MKSLLQAVTYATIMSVVFTAVFGSVGLVFDQLAGYLFGDNRGLFETLMAFGTMAAIIWIATFVLGLVILKDKGLNRNG